MNNTSERLISLDVFRGITIAGMILVNDPGDWGNVYPALLHAKWNGCTPTDLIFPFFLFIVGVSITLSLTKRKERGDNQSKLVLQILKRSFLIFFIGLILNGFPYFNLSTLRIPGVLQRIAVVYLIASLMFLKTNWKTQSIIAVVLLFSYWAIIALVPVPDFGKPDLSVPVVLVPTTNQFISPNITGWLDNLLLGGHLWGQTKVWDPEGILSTIPAVSTCIFGMLLGEYLRTGSDKTQKTVWIFVFGNTGIAVGIIWDMFFPLNKNLWTSSYVVYTAGFALVLFAMCFWFIDVKGYKRWAKPFVVYGTNAIAVYFLSEIFAILLYVVQWTNSTGQTISLGSFLYQTFFTPFLSPINASLAWAIVYVMFWCCIMWIFYIKKIFIKV